jgi:hypothetical protein
LILESGANRLSRNVGEQLPRKMRNIPEERRPLVLKFSFVGLEIGCDISDGNVRQIIIDFGKGLEYWK